MSPRSTKTLHECSDLKHFASIDFIGLKRGDLTS